jgi:hypothetical protein
VGDFLGSDQGRAILQNSALTLLLRQDPSAIDQVVGTLKLSAGERDFLLHCARGRGLLCTPENRVAVEIIAAPAEHRLITSDPRELARLEREDDRRGPSPAQRDRHEEEDSRERYGDEVVLPARPARRGPSHPDGQVAIA